MSEPKYKCISCGFPLEEKINVTEVRMKTTSSEGKISEAAATLKVCDNCFMDARDMMLEFEKAHKENES
jgi:hypothetical protein